MAILANALKETGINLALPVANNIFLAPSVTVFATSCLIAGQPLFSLTPASDGHLSSSSFTPSPSLSGTGQPW